MLQAFHAFLAPVAGLLPWLLGFFLAYGALAKLTPCHKGQPLLHRDMLTDLLYVLLFACCNRLVRIAFLSAGAFVLFAPAHAGQPLLAHYLEHGYGPLARLPVWLQAAILLLASDMVLYWTHRWFHGRRLWRFHAIHHAPARIDWLTAYRFHPVNVWSTFTLLDALSVMAGFSPAALAALSVFNTVYSPMVHANLNWTFGRLRYVLASPVFHRWHHTTQAEGLDKNFAPTFPILDILFGTFYMPKGELPQRYGLRGQQMEGGLMRQLVWPFKKQRNT